MIDVLLNILHYSIGSLFWGILIGLACLALFFFLIKGWWKDAEFSLISYVVGGVLGILLIYECTLICGSLAIIRAADDFHDIATTVVSTMVESGDYLPGTIVDKEESQQVMDQIVEQHPILGHFVNLADFSGNTLADLPDRMTDTMKSYMRWYIVRRLLWALGFVLVAAVIVIKTMSHGAGTRSHAPIRGAARTPRTSSTAARRPDMRRSRYRQ